MTNMAAIKAVFYNWRPVVGHKRLQLIFEVPLEDTNVVLKMLGAPMPDKETWCAIALLDTDQKPREPSFTTRRQFCDLPFVQQAGILAKDMDFQFWINGGSCSELDCAAKIRKHCGVESRADIVAGTDAGDKWLSLLREYEAH